MRYSITTLRLTRRKRCDLYGRNLRGLKRWA